MLLSANKLGVLMREIALFLVLAAVSFAWENAATADMLQSEYEYAACNVQFARDYVALREECGRLHDTHVFDFSGRMEEIEDALDDAQEGAEQGNRLEYGAAMFRLNANMAGLVLEVIGDALNNKSQGYRNCVQEDVGRLEEELEECRASAFETGKRAAHAYLANDIEKGESEVAELEAMRADILGMERVLDYARALDEDIDAAYDSHQVQEVKKLYERHSRLVLLFRLEKMMSVIDYAEPIIEAGTNENKEELLEEMADLKGDTEDLTEECAYSPDVDSGYAAENMRCWTEGLSLMQRFNALYTLYWAGV